jgi:arginyl-tRNA synthetase
LNKKKFEIYPLDLSVIITGNEINEYFKVLLKAMELVIPEVAKNTRHISHGMLRLTSGKMSSRTGDVITAEWLIDQAKIKIKEKENADIELSEEERKNNSELIAIGAIKYSVLKQGPGRDIIFDFDKSLSVEGDSGPYLQYTYARLNNILVKAGATEPADAASLKEVSELNLIKELLEFPLVVREGGKNIAPQYLVQYLHRLASSANRFYESIPVLKDENSGRRSARLMLIKATAAVLERGLSLLGIRVLSKI